MKKRKRDKVIRGGGEEQELSSGSTYNLHNDKRDTLVNINGDLFKLVPIGKTLKELLKEPDHSKVPHVRHLNPIQLRTSAEQERKNKEAESIHELAKQVNGGRSDKITSIKKAMALGANVPEAVKKLMEDKKKAQAEGDEKKCRLIRRQLRALDYKRYMK